MTFWGPACIGDPFVQRPVLPGNPLRVISAERLVDTAVKGRNGEKRRKSRKKRRKPRRLRR